MDSLSRHLSSYHSNHNSGESTAGHRKRRDRLGPGQLNIVPIPREELPDEMRSVLESFISSRRPSLADLRLASPGAQHASTSAPTEDHEGFDYDGTHHSNSNWTPNFSLKGKKFPSRVYHTHKVVPRSRPNAKEQLGRRKWHPSKRHGRVIQQEDYDACAVRELGQTTQISNSGSLLDLSLRGGKAVDGMTGESVSGSGLCGWPCSWKSKLWNVTKIFRRA